MKPRRQDQILKIGKQLGNINLYLVLNKIDRKFLFDWERTTILSVSAAYASSLAKQERGNSLCGLDSALDKKEYQLMFSLTRRSQARMLDIESKLGILKNK